MTLLRRMWNGLYRGYWTDDWSDPSVLYAELEEKLGEYNCDYEPVVTDENGRQKTLSELTEKYLKV